jgi:hypothetical protein
MRRPDPAGCSDGVARMTRTARRPPSAIGASPQSPLMCRPRSYHSRRPVSRPHEGNNWLLHHVCQHSWGRESGDIHRSPGPDYPSSGTGSRSAPATAPGDPAGRESGLRVVASGTGTNPALSGRRPLASRRRLDLRHRPPLERLARRAGRAARRWGDGIHPTLAGGRALPYPMRAEAMLTAC